MSPPPARFFVVTAAGSPSLSPHRLPVSLHLAASPLLHLAASTTSIGRSPLFLSSQPPALRRQGVPTSIPARSTANWSSPGRMTPRSDAPELGAVPSPPSPRRRPLAASPLLHLDVSHMCGLSLHSRQAIPFLESLVVADVVGLNNGTGTLTVFTNERGGAIDDSVSVVTKVTDQHIYLVVNARCRVLQLRVRVRRRLLLTDQIRVVLLFSHPDAGTATATTSPPPTATRPQNPQLPGRPQEEQLLFEMPRHCRRGRGPQHRRRRHPAHRQDTDGVSQQHRQGLCRQCRC